MTPRAWRRLRSALLAALLASPGLPAPAAATLPDDSERQEWQERVADARAEVERARQRRDAAETAVHRMRHRRRPRGDAREALFAARDAARMDLVDAERSLDELLEEARRAGVPPGWLRAPAAHPPASAE